MAERASAREPAPRRWWLLLLPLAPLGGGCGADAGQARLLDRLCATELGQSAQGEPVWGCTLSGDARAVTGLTGDSTGIELGSGYGMLAIRLAALDLAAPRPGALHREQWSFDALVASARTEEAVLLRVMTWGSCRHCPDAEPDAAFSLTDDYAWGELVVAAPGLAEPASVADVTEIPNDAWLVLSGADVQIVDVRLPGI